MSELKLKTELKPASRTLLGCKLAEDATFFGIHTNSLSATMQGLHLGLNAKGHLEVTHDSYPGKVCEVYPAGIVFLTWSEA